jgi:hypothetical protein
MAIKARENLIGARAFLIGLIVALAVGIFTGLIPEISAANPYIVLVMALLGVFAGFFVAEKDVQIFLLASVSIVLVSYAWISGLLLSAAASGVDIRGIMTSVLQSLLELFVPATVVVALKTVFSIAKS